MPFDRVFRDDPDALANARTRLGELGLKDGLSFTADRRRLRTSMRDFARIAWFWLNRGRWQGRELLPAKYLDEYMRPQTPKDPPVSSGFVPRHGRSALGIDVRYFVII